MMLWGHTTTWLLSLRVSNSAPFHYGVLDKIKKYYYIEPWVYFGRNDAKAETPVFWPPHGKSWLIRKYSDAGRDWGQEEKGTTEGGWGWMTSLTRWTWVWVNSKSWWWTGRPGVLQFMGSQRVRHDWATELNWATLVSLWIVCGWFHSTMAELTSCYRDHMAPKNIFTL